MGKLGRKSFRSYFSLIAILILVAGFALPATAQDFDGYLYWIKTGESKTMSWDAAENALSYKFQIIQIENNMVYASGTVGTFPIQITFVKFGHYKLAVKSVGETEESAWSYSTDSKVATVNGQPKAWIVYAFLAPPSGGEVGK